MLSRTASNLYWLARYMERAENLVRILDVSFNITLMPNAELSAQELHIPLQVTGTAQSYFLLHDKLTRNDLLKFFSFDEANPNSVISCFARARDNAKAVRSILSSEVWEALNSSWIELQNIRRKGPIYDAPDFFEWVKAQSHLFRGAVYGTILRNDTLCFLRLGTHIERADNTARILSSKSQYISDIESVKYYRWNTLLRALGAFEAYHQIYGDEISVKQVAELLILREEVPRSLLSCLQFMQDAIESIEGDRGREAKRRIATMHSNLKYGNTRYIMKRGIDLYLYTFLDHLSGIVASIQEAYMETI